MTTPARREPAASEQVLLIPEKCTAKASAVPPRGASPTKVFREWSPEQSALLPASKRDYLGDDHLTVFLLDLLPTLNLEPILAAYTEDRGQPPYDPRMMTVLLLYAYGQGVTSSRQIERGVGKISPSCTSRAMPARTTTRSARFGGSTWTPSGGCFWRPCALPRKRAC